MKTKQKNNGTFFRNHHTLKQSLSFKINKHNKKETQENKQKNGACEYQLESEGDGGESCDRRR